MTVMGLSEWLSARFGRSSEGVHSDAACIPGFEKLQDKLGYRFADTSIIRTALTHRSHVYRTGQERLKSNERLEFLGDSVLELVVNEYLFHRYPDRSEGELTKVKSLIVSGAVLAKAAEEIVLGDHLIMAPSEVEAGGRTRTSILSDAYEAVLGAVYLDGGLDPVRRIVTRELLESLEETLADQHLANYKSLLQEKIQAHYKTPPRYKVSSTSGPDHAKRFVVEVLVRGLVLGHGEGTSKKLAEQRAAHEALDRMQNDADLHPGA